MFADEVGPFWQGYRAFVIGGRVAIYSGASAVTKILDTSIEPFDSLSDGDKAKWREGVEYAKKERAECRALPPERATFETSESEFKELMRKRLPIRKIAAKIGITVQCAQSWKTKIKGEVKLKQKDAK